MKKNMNPLKEPESGKVKETKQTQTAVPWQDEAQWEQVFESIQRIAERQIEIIGPIRDLAAGIYSHYGQLTGIIEDICSHSCPGCLDVCCIRATLWFDFKDLLYIYFAFGSLPKAQISKKIDDGVQSCCHLTEKGCSLSRTQRPFVCTWYFCPPQKEYLSLQDSEMQNTIDGHLKEIKLLREKIEDEFIRAASF